MAIGTCTSSSGGADVSEPMSKAVRSVRNTVADVVECSSTWCPGGNCLLQQYLW